jgi:nitrate reductase gamma subunit
MSALHGLVYLSVLIFLVACITRAVRIARAPMHLRWELQPVPHEKPGKSMFEKVDWWEHAREKNHFGELAIMIPEILLLRGVWEHNRSLWFPSFALHFGLYMLIGNMVLAMALAIMLITGGTAGAGFGLILMQAIKGLAVVGGGLGTIGCVTMFIKRISDPGMSKYATPSHYFNLLHLGAIYLTALLWAMLDTGFVVGVSGLYAGIFTLNAIPALPIIGLVHVAVVLLFFVYLPFTHMTHFFTKYFTYHSVRWSDEPNLPGSKLEKSIVKNVTQPVSWAAPHIGADGKKTWVDLVSGTGEVKTEKEA